MTAEEGLIHGVSVLAGSLAGLVLLWLFRCVWEAWPRRTYTSADIQLSAASGARWRLIAAQREEFDRSMAEYYRMAALPDAELLEELRHVIDREKPTTREEAIKAALREHPHDAVTRAALHDWLVEHGRDAEAQRLYPPPE